MMHDQRRRARRRGRRRRGWSAGRTARGRCGHRWWRTTIGSGTENHRRSSPRSRAGRRTACRPVEPSAGRTVGDVEDRTTAARWRATHRRRPRPAEGRSERPAVIRRGRAARAAPPSSRHDPEVVDAVVRRRRTGSGRRRAKAYRDWRTPTAASPISASSGATSTARASVGRPAAGAARLTAAKRQRFHQSVRSDTNVQRPVGRPLGLEDRLVAAPGQHRPGPADERPPAGRAALEATTHSSVPSHGMSGWSHCRTTPASGRRGSGRGAATKSGPVTRTTARPAAVGRPDATISLTGLDPARRGGARARTPPSGRRRSGARRRSGHRMRHRRLGRDRLGSAPSAVEAVEALVGPVGEEHDVRRAPTRRRRRTRAPGCGPRTPRAARRPGAPPGGARTSWTRPPSCGPHLGPPDVVAVDPHLADRARRRARSAAGR